MLASDLLVPSVLEAHAGGYGGPGEANGPATLLSEDETSGHGQLK